MGIQNLLQFIKPALERKHISEFSNQKCAIDAMSWLYKACYGSTFELNRSIDRHDYVLYIQRMVCMLKLHDIQPVLVFDGRELVAKEATKKNRKDIKFENKKKGQEAIKSGNIKEARKYFSRCIEITDEIFYFVVDAMKQLKLEVMIAPYESDAQVSYLVREKICDFAISEDSDLIAYGCERVLFQLASNGFGDFLDLEKFRTCPDKRKELKDDQLKSFFAFSDEQMIQACIMAGCDYLPSVKGVGIQTSVGFINQYGGAERTINILQSEKKYRDRVPDSYLQFLNKIKKIFLFQTIFDVKQQQLVHYRDEKTYGAKDMLNSNKKAGIEGEKELENNENHNHNQLNQVNLRDKNEWNEATDSVGVGPFFDDAQQFVQGTLNIRTFEERPYNYIDLKSIYQRDKVLMKILKEQFQQEQFRQILCIVKQEHQKKKDIEQIKKLNQIEREQEGGDQQQQQLWNNQEQKDDDITKRGYRQIKKDNLITTQEQDFIFKLLKEEDQKEAEELFHRVNREKGEFEKEQGTGNEFDGEGDDGQEENNGANFDQKDLLRDYCKFYNDYQAELERKEIEKINKQIGVAKITKTFNSNHDHQEGNNKRESLEIKQENTQLSSNPFLQRASGNDTDLFQDSLAQIKKSSDVNMNSDNQKRLFNITSNSNSNNDFFLGQDRTASQDRESIPGTVNQFQKRKVSEDTSLNYSELAKSNFRKIKRNSDDFTQKNLNFGVLQSPNSNKQNLFDYFQQN